MKKLHVWSPERGYRRLKAGVTLESYQIKFPNAKQVCAPPSMKTMERWVSNGVAKATDGCRVEPDGICQHGAESWIRALGWI